MARVLLTTVFKPFGIDNLYGRAESNPEIFHNRLTRNQGIFSYRSHFQALGLHVIANNIETDCTVLEYPTFKRFIKELKKGYDYVGIGSAMCNLQKLKLMAETIREEAPRSKIIIGGFCASLDNLSEMIPLDYLCVGEGISFMRELLGEPAEFKFKNPDAHSIPHSLMGVPLWWRKNPQIIVGLGCPYGCEFCQPSHFFGRKHIRFFKNGDDLFDEMERMERVFNSRNIAFNGDDNFLMDRKRAEGLRERVMESGRQYDLFYFASAKDAKQFGVDRLAEMGTSLIWLGRESSLIKQAKTEGVDFKELIEEMHCHGIKVILSSMLFMDHHTPDDIWKDIEDHISTKPDFSMLPYCSVAPGTPYYERLKKEGRILFGMPYEDWNGISFPYTLHPLFSSEECIRIRTEALDLEFNTLGPSIMRIIRTDLEGSLYMADSDNPVLRKRAGFLAGNMSRYRAALWAIARLVPTNGMRDTAEELLSEVERAYGPITGREKAMGAGVWSLGAKEKLRHRLVGDVIQPRTMLTRYPGPA
jgi:hypothetical protein